MQVDSPSERYTKHQGGQLQQAPRLASALVLPDPRLTVLRLCTDRQVDDWLHSFAWSMMRNGFLKSLSTSGDEQWAGLST